MIIGLTGGIATGKSTVANMLEKRGARIVDADKIAREIVLPGSPVLQQVASRFGQAILQEDGSLNRKKLGDIIFSDPKAKKDLEQLLHPPIRNILRQRVQQYEEENPQGLVVADIPLLFESGLQSMFPEIMVVYVPESVQLKRLMARNGLNESEARARIQNQWPIEDKKQLADVLIDNSGTLQETEEQIADFWQGKGLAAI